MAPLNVIEDSQVVWHCDNDPQVSKLLNYHHPDIPNLGDVTKINFNEVGAVDILTAGYPCQPFSTQGSRTGDKHEQYLFDYVRSAISALRPKFTLLENVPGHRTLGFDRVFAGLAADGLYARWVYLRASEVGTPHGRGRFFILVSETPDTRSLGLQQVGLSWEPKKNVSPTSNSELLLSDADADDIWDKWAGSISHWESILGRKAPLAVEKWRDNKKPRITIEFLEWMMGLPKGLVSDPDIKIAHSHKKKIIGNGVCPQQAIIALKYLLDDSNFGIINA